MSQNVKALKSLLNQKLLSKTQFDILVRKAEKLAAKTAPKKAKVRTVKKRPVIKSTARAAKIRMSRENLDNDGAAAVRQLVKVKYEFTNADSRNLERWVVAQTNAGNRLYIEFFLNDGSTVTRTLSQNSVDDITELLEQRYFKRKRAEPITSSDALEEVEVTGFYDVKITAAKIPKKIIKNKSGRFFNFINTTDLDLSKYQIVREDQVNSQILNEHCLIYALKQHNIDNAKLQAIKLTLETGEHVAKSKLYKVADVLKQNIILHQYRSNDKNQELKEYQETHGDYETSLDIAIHSDHYFIYEPTQYSGYSIKNYNEVKDLDEFENISKKRINGKDGYRRDGLHKVNSLKLVDLLMKGGHFSNKSTSLNDMVNFRNKSRDEFDIPLDNIENEQDDLKLKEQKEKLNAEPTEDTNTYFFADTESLVDTNPHRGFLSGIVTLDAPNPKIFMRNAANPDKWLYDTLFYIYQNVKTIDVISDDPEIESTTAKANAVVFYHNLKYDYHLFKKHLTHFKANCEKDGQLYEVQGVFKGVKIHFRDSYKLVPKKLADFADMFSLPEDMKKKEAIAYSYYNEKNIYETEADVNDYLKHVHNTYDDFKKVDNKLKFKANIHMKDENGEYLFDYDPIKNTFNHMKYYRYYLKYDVMVLKEGLKVFNDKIKKITELSIFNTLTISSLTHKYMLREGAYDEVYAVCGLLREFISMGVFGGRVELLETHKKKIITDNLVDFDAVSLYPSAIYRMCQEIGVPKGKAKRLTLDMKLDTLDYYVVKIKITKINKKQQMPFIAYRHDSVIDYINTVPEGGLMTIVDKITLEDYVKFHKIEYEVLDGVYWNEGFNKKFGCLIEKLFKNRLEEKKLKKKYEGVDNDRAGGHDAMQEIIKLMLNSAYGKTIISKSKTEKVIVRRTSKGSKEIDDNINQYKYNHFHVITDVNHLNDRQTEVTKVTIDTSFNIAHVGCMVLSYSKRIMNEVMDIANDAQIKIYYQDTDSMHLKREDLDQLIKLYNAKYGRELVGKNMCQFHSDFKLEGAVSEVYSIMSIFLGKKCYLDVLEGFDKDGNKINGHHIRMKGVNNEGLTDRVNKDYQGDWAAMYSDLADGKSIKFILNANDKAVFEFKKNGTVQTRTDVFGRNIGFNKQDLEYVKYYNRCVKLGMDENKAAKIWME